MILTYIFRLLAAISLAFSLQIYSMEQSPEQTPPAQQQAEPALKKIIISVSSPRSVSAALTRMMDARGGFKIMHEPGQLAYLKLLHPEWDLAQYFRKDAPQTFEEVKNSILSQGQNNPLFIKSMAPTFLAFLTAHPELFKNPQVYFNFLVRNPHDTVISFYRKYKDPTQPDFSGLIGYQAMYELWIQAKNEAANSPSLILVDDLDKDAEGTIQSFCASTHIPYLPKSLQWKALGDDFNGEQWMDEKTPEAILEWHGNALKSTGFHPSTKYKVDPTGNPTFEEIKEDENHRALCIAAYLENLKYYKLLLAAALPKTEQ